MADVQARRDAGDGAQGDVWHATTLDGRRRIIFKLKWLSDLCSFRTQEEAIDRKVCEQHAVIAVVSYLSYAFTLEGTDTRQADTFLFLNEELVACVLVSDRGHSWVWQLRCSSF